MKHCAAAMYDEKGVTLFFNEDPIPAVQFTRKEAERALGRAGFDVRSVDYYDMEVLPPTFAGNHPKVAQQLARVFERLPRAPFWWLGSAMLIEAFIAASG